MLFATASYGQSTIPQNKLVSIPPTPEASSLLKFIETPISKYTGVADVEIPVYDIKLKDLVLPIGLKYHGSGYKLEEQSGSLGIGWGHSRLVVPLRVR